MIRKLRRRSSKSGGALWMSLFSTAALVTYCSVLCGCGVLGVFSNECSEVSVALGGDDASPIANGLRFLAAAQLKSDNMGKGDADYAGDWPQCFAFDRDGPFIRDVSPFVPAFVHHSLSLVTLDSIGKLGLTSEDASRARAMRLRAIKMINRFQAGDEKADRRTFGFWPVANFQWSPGDVLLEAAIGNAWSGPQFHGYRVPLNVTFFPRCFAIPTDADVTATAYSALLDSHRFDGGKALPDDVASIFASWRDLGNVPQRNTKPWLPQRSGAFLTWLAFRTPIGVIRPNDVDVPVNANVLFLLGRLGALGTPGVEDSIHIINESICEDVDLHDGDQFSLYYPDNLSLHYFVTRAYREGGVSELRPSVDRLVDDLEQTVVHTDGEQAYWDFGDVDLNTAFAVLSLLSAGEREDLVDGGIEFLKARQDPVTGSWESGVFFLGRLDDGTTPVWVSQSFTTAMAIEALCRYRLQLEL